MGFRKDSGFLFRKIKMQEEKQIIEPGSENDPDNPRGILARLANKVPASFIPGKIIWIENDVTKFLCPNHETRMVVEMKESSQRHKNNKMTEFTCTCGAVYKKKK